MRTTNIRFQEKRKEDDRAWGILHKLEELNCKSQSALVVRALNAYYDRHLKKQADPYFETREKEDAFADRIVDVIEKKVFSMLPTMVGMAFMQQIAGMNGNVGNQMHGNGADGNGSGQMAKMYGNPADAMAKIFGMASLVNEDVRCRKEEAGQQIKQMEVLTEEDDVEENELLDTDLF